jgi:hypothetical protein
MPCVGTWATPPEFPQLELSPPWRNCVFDEKIVLWGKKQRIPMKTRLKIANKKVGDKD